MSVCEMTVLDVLRTGQSMWDGAGVLAQVVLVEALRVALPKQPGDLLLHHRPHCLGQVCTLIYYTHTHTVSKKLKNNLKKRFFCSTSGFLPRLTSFEEAHQTLVQPGVGGLDGHSSLYGLQHQQVLLCRNEDKQIEIN